MKILRLSLKVKLFCIVILMIAFLIPVIAGTGYYYYSYIENANHLKSNINTIVKKILKNITTKNQLMLSTEKSKLAFKKEMKFIDIELKRISTHEINPKWKSNCRSLKKTFQKFQKSVFKISETYVQHDILKQSMTAQLKLIETTLNNMTTAINNKEELDYEKQKLVDIIRETRIIFLKLQNIQQQFFIKGEAKFLNQFKNYFSKKFQATITTLIMTISLIDDAELAESGNIISETRGTLISSMYKSQELFQKTRQTEQTLLKAGQTIMKSANMLLVQTDQFITDKKNEAVLSISVGIPGGCLLLFILFYITLIRIITQPISSIAGTMKNFDNDLTTRVTIVNKDEIGDLAHWFNGHIQNLHIIIQTIFDSITEVNSSAGEISTLVDEQVSFSSQLSSSIVEISSTMEEFSATATQIAEHTTSVVEIADSSLKDTKEGATAVENISEKMDTINEYGQNNLKAVIELGRKSKEITKVMELINNIANQTKLIAFNAALEASSAGDAGKRFSVVASEIRHLANNVMESTGEIEGKINEILETVNNMVIASENSSKVIHEGLEYSNQTAAMLKLIVEGAESTTNAAKQISLSTRQQQSASDQVVTALLEIEKGSKQGDESINRINLISSQLKDLSKGMLTLIKRFKL